jgi:hypothetical protein
VTERQQVTPERAVQRSWAVKLQAEVVGFVPLQTARILGRGSARIDEVEAERSQLAAVVWDLVQQPHTHRHSGMSVMQSVSQ